jgi:hypothetical protein
VVYQSSTSALTTIKSSVSSTSNIVMASSMQLMSSVRKTESDASIEGDDAVHDANSLDNKEISASEPSTTLAYSFGLTVNAAKTIMTFGK